MRINNRKIIFILFLSCSSILAARSPELFGGIFFAGKPEKIDREYLQNEILNGLFLDVNGDYQGGRLRVGITYDDENLLFDSSAAVRVLLFRKLNFFGPEIEGGIGIRTLTGFSDSIESQRGNIYSFLGIGAALRLNRFYSSLNYRYFPFSFPVPGEKGLPSADNQITMAIGIEL